MRAGAGRPPRGGGVAPRLKLPVAAKPLGFGAASFQRGQYFVMRIVGSQMQAEVEPGRAQCKR
jgi:hypothetical protein